MGNQSLTAKPTPVIFLMCSFLNTWMFVCFFRISANSVLFCLFSLLYVPGCTSCRCVIQLSKCLRLQKHLFILFLPCHLWYASFPLIQQPSLFFSSPSQAWAASQRPSFCSEETFGHSPNHQCPLPTLLGCSLFGWDVLCNGELSLVPLRNRECGLTVGCFPFLCLKLLLGKLSQGSDLTKADLYPRLHFQKCSHGESDNLLSYWATLPTSCRFVSL